MMNKRVLTKVLRSVSAVLVLIGAGQFGWSNIGQAKKPDLGSPSALNVVAEYKKDRLLDISADGRWLLFVEKTKPLEEGGDIARENILRVVELKTGREIRRTVGVLIWYAKFVSDTNSVFYPEYTTDFKGYVLKLWDPVSDKTRIVSSVISGATAFPITLLDQEHAFAVLWKPEGYFALRLSLSEQVPSDAKLLGPPALENILECDPSPDGKLVAIVAEDRHILIWDVESEHVAAEVRRPPELFFDVGSGEHIVYSPDDKLMAVSAYSYVFVPGKKFAEWRAHVLVYDTRTYQLIRQIRVPGTGRIAISPDSRLLAAAFTEESSRRLFGLGTVRLSIGLFDINTSEEIARASHTFKIYSFEVRGGDIKKLAFTPDGKYLLSSTADTRVWEIENSSDKRLKEG